MGVEDFENGGDDEEEKMVKEALKTMRNCGMEEGGLCALPIPSSMKIRESAGQSKGQSASKKRKKEEGLGGAEKP